MQTWEYRVEHVGGKRDSDVAALLNTFGQSGWELVSASHQAGEFARLVFKRPKSA